MKKQIFTFLTAIIFSHNSIAQNKLDNEWITGAGGQRILFNNGTVSTSVNYFVIEYFSGGNSNICDSNGNLLLASDGFNVYDNTETYLDGGDTLSTLDYYVAHNGRSFLSQNSIFLPIDSNKFYFINGTMSDIRYSDCQANNNCYFDLLFYNLIDMNANGGAGKVVRRMQPLIQNANLRKTQMMACRHGNGKDWWLVKNEGENANVHTFLFTQDSVYDKGVQVFNSPVWGSWDIRGQSTFNSDGSLFATTSHGSSTGLIFLADFDRCYGQLINPRIIQMPYGSQQIPADTTIKERLSVGLAFSPNNNYLYVASMSNIYQYDLQDNTWYHVYGIDTTYLQFTDYETAYLAPDNKIYFGNFGGGSKQMSRIDNPDVKGAGCNFCPRCLRLDSLGANAYVGTPPCMPDYGLGAKTCWPLEASLTPPIGGELLEVYPNPSTNFVYVQFTAESDGVFTIYNSLGEKLFSKKLSKSITRHRIDLDNVASGLYHFEIEYTNKVKSIGKITVVN